jgi:hypothetical protein
VLNSRVEWVFKRGRAGGVVAHTGLSNETGVGYRYADVAHIDHRFFEKRHLAVRLGGQQRSSNDQGRRQNMPARRQAFGACLGDATVSARTKSEDWWHELPDEKKPEWPRRNFPATYQPIGVR